MCVAGKNSRQASALRAGGGLARRQGASNTEYSTFGNVQEKQYKMVTSGPNAGQYSKISRIGALQARKQGYTNVDKTGYFKTVNKTVETKHSQANALNRTQVQDQGEALKKTRNVRNSAANRQQTSSLKGRKGRSKLRIDSASGLGSNSGGSGVSYGG